MYGLHLLHQPVSSVFQHHQGHVMLNLFKALDYPLHFSDVSLYGQVSVEPWSLVGFC